MSQPPLHVARRKVMLGLPAVVASPGIQAACPSDLEGRVDILSNAFPAMSHLAMAADRCQSSRARISVKLTPTARQETEQGFAMRSRCPFDAAIVSMSVFSDLYARGQLSSMTDLYRQADGQLEETQLVRVDEELMALAFMSNTQILYYRKDLLDRSGLPPPRDYAELLQAAAKLQRDHGLRYPVAQTFAKGWDCATEFSNLFVALGGRFFQKGSAEPSFQNHVGVSAIEIMRAQMRFMSPNALSSNSDDVMNQLQQGRAALGVLWASRAARMDEPTASRVVGKIEFAAAPAALPRGPSAAHLWWDGFVMPRRSKAPRETTFSALRYLLDPIHVRSGNDLAIWTHSSFRPGRFGSGVALAKAAGAATWPTEPFFGLAHSEIGQWIPEALAGERTPQDALQRAAGSYVRLAREKGFLRT
ncbi:MAG: extracellular solute-binding protein [Betaproteobacteria bacterium]|nr:extracellular solute-binding protein [Betaproteobacteria bacterium]